jgi:hypothetical protein
MNKKTRNVQAGCFIHLVTFRHRLNFRKKAFGHILNTFNFLFLLFPEKRIRNKKQKIKNEGVFVNPLTFRHRVNIRMIMSVIPSL